MPTYLDKILDATRERIASEFRGRFMGELEEQAAAAPAPRDFLKAMYAPGISLIGEFKRRSPSKGAIREGLLPAGVAWSYQQGGARAMSVLTEPRFFDGSLDDLKDARMACNLPVLRKDFFIHPYQILQARAAGADAILLIVAALPDRALFADLAEMARRHGMAVLIEVHDLHELDAAFEVAPRLIGVNQRNLSSFEMDLTLALRMRLEIPRELAMVAESGISGRLQVKELEDAGVDAILVGETLMRADNPARAVSALLGVPV
ncbi:MAG: indole-3-glycerol phosphate synthase TrpC [Actinomycetota bacterium]